MKKVIAAVTAVSLALVSSCGSDTDQKVATSQSAGASEIRVSPTSDAPLDAGKEEPISVLDSSGRARGWVRRSDLEERESLIIEYAMTERVLEGGRMADVANRKPVMDAIGAMFAIEVRGDGGELTGYFANGFIEVSEYPALLRSAEEFVHAL